MKTIWKFTMPILDEVVLEMPIGAHILSVQAQPDSHNLLLWAQVDSDAPTEQRVFRTVGTGHPMDPQKFELDSVLKHPTYLGTNQFDGGLLVFHTFEVYP